MPTVQVHAAMGRRRRQRHVCCRDDCVRARSRRFLGGVVRALSHDLARARGPRRASRGAPQGRKGRRRRESTARCQVRRAIDPVAGRNPGRSGERPRCRRTASRCAGAAVGTSARRLSVDPGSSFRERHGPPRWELLELRVKEVCDVIARVANASPFAPRRQTSACGQSARPVSAPPAIPSSPLRSRDTKVARRQKQSRVSWIVTFEDGPS
jgi:hypothetical protein